jgi:cadmium resistance transport/sequestration family protein
VILDFVLRIEGLMAMNGLLTAMTTGIAAFIATNIDDIFILTLLFTQVNAIFCRRHIVVGQYLGFSLLLLASLPGLLGNFLIPDAWIRLLGLVPIAIGLGCFLKEEDDGESQAPISSDNKLPKTSFLSHWLSPQTYGVAAVTVANGSDNIGVYVPLFANTALENLPIILGVFLTLVGLWCYIAYQLTNLPVISSTIIGYGQTFVPCVLIGLGVFIVKESLILTVVALGVSYLWLITFGKKYPPVSEVETD